MFELFNEVTVTNLSKKFLISLVVVLLLTVTNRINAQSDYLNSIKKIDIHTHIQSDAPYLRQIMDSLNFKLISVCYEGSDIERLNRQIEAAKVYTSEYPRYYGWITAFDLTERDKPNWTANVIKKLKSDFDNGAIGVKIWKDIGIGIKDANGNYIQVDDPMFTPIFEFIAQEGKTLLAHIGEPITAWMSPKPGTYWAKHPQYSNYDRPDKPSYSSIVATMDHIIERHPNLRIVGAHLASLEFDVDELAKRFDKYPNFAADIGGRTRYLMWQARGKVRAFFIKYQDRILYGTDKFGGLINEHGEDLSSEEIETSRNQILDRYDFFTTYYTTDKEIPWSDYIISDKPVEGATYTVKGLALPNEVLDKIYYENAVKWFPGVEKEYN